jgi:hypothetical protein
MYGMIHRAARQMVTEKFGAPLWARVETEAATSEDHFISGAPYSDDITFAVIRAVATVTGLTTDEVLRAFGQYWIHFAGESAFASVMKMAGDDLPGFIRQLDRMHRSIQAALPDAVLPEFELVAHDERGLVVRYRSERSGLEEFVVGLLEGLLHRFDLTGSIRTISEGDSARFEITYSQTQGS